MHARAAILPALLCLASACAPPQVGADDEAADEAALTDGRNVLYLNFEGGRFQRADCDDARRNCSAMAAYDGVRAPAFDASPYGARGAVIGRIVAGVRKAFSGLNLVVTTTRPASGDYHMVVVGGKSLDVLGLWVGGRSGVGCGDQNKDAIAFVTPFYDSRPGEQSLLDAWRPVEPFFSLSPTPEKQEEWHESELGIIRNIAHEAGHTFGLVHTQGFSASNPTPADFMCEEAACRNAPAFEFKRALMSIDGSQGHCADAATQSSYEVLRANLE